MLAPIAVLAMVLLGHCSLSHIELHPAAGQEPEARQDFQLAIDADIDNGSGPCDPIDEEVRVPVGASHRVALCVLNQPEAPQAFFVRVTYDGTLNRALDKPDSPSATDGNPDANAGLTTFSSPDLGPEWDCTGFGMYPPTGDTPATEQFDAQIACHSSFRNRQATLSESGPLAVMTFEAVGEGVDRIEFDKKTDIGGASGLLGTCGQTPIKTIPCRGATVFKGMEPTTPVVPTPLQEETPEAMPPERTPLGEVAEPSPAGVGRPAESQGGGFPWAVLGGALGGAALLLLALGGGVYLWRRV